MLTKIGFSAFIFLLLGTCEFTLYAQQILFIEKGVENYSLGRYLAMMEDKDGELSINEAASDSMQSKYVYHDKETLNLRLTQSAYWLRFIVVDTLTYSSSEVLGSQFNRTWILIKNEPVFEDIHLYYRDINSEEKEFTEKAAGSIVDVDDKIIKTNNFIAGFQIPKNQADTVYLRVKTRSQFIISFSLLTTGEYVEQNSRKNLFHGILFGIFILLVAYNTLLYFSIKEKTYIIYSLYIFCYTFFIFTYEGYFFEIFGRIFYQDYFILSVGTISLSGFFWLLLTREFLSTKSNLPWAYNLLTYLSPLAPIICFCMFVFNYHLLLILLILSLLGYFVLGFILATITLRKGVIVSKYYLLAIGGMIFFIIISSSAKNNFLPLPYNFWTQNALNFGVLWEAIILAAAVGYRFSHLKAEKEREKALMRNQIASDLHDEIGSNLSTISLQSKLMLKDQKLDENSREQLQSITNIAGTTTDTIRDIVWFINPFHDNPENLLLRMKELASKMLVNIEYSFTSSTTDKRIFEKISDLNKRRHIYLIFKEVLNNIIKHSGASEVKISLSSEIKKFRMIIIDNGKGFVEENTVLGSGLKNLKSRAGQINGQILIESNVGKGTKIELDVPV